MRTVAWKAEWSDGEALLIMTMEEEKLWVQIVSIDTPSSSHRSALLDTQICLLAHHEPSATTSYDQPRQLRRLGWAELRPTQASTTAPCARRAPTLHRNAAGAVLCEEYLRLEEASRRSWKALKSASCLLPSSCPHRAPCRTRAWSPRCASTRS